MNVYYLYALIKSQLGTNNSDFLIINSIAELLKNNEKCTQEQVIKLSNVSISTLIRFVRNLGFGSYREFISYCASCSNERKLTRDEYLSCDSFDCLLNSGRDALNEIQKQKKQILKARDIIMNSSRVLFSGFIIPQGVYSLQSFLYSRNIESFAYTNIRHQVKMMNYVKEKDTLVVIDCGFNSDRLFSLVNRRAEKCTVCSVGENNLDYSDCHIMLPKSSIVEEISIVNMIMSGIYTMS